MLKMHSMCLAALAAAGILGAMGCQSTGTESMVQEEQPKAESSPAKIAAEEPKPRASATTFEAVYFNLDRWQLSEEARQVLKESAKQIEAHPELGVVTIEGHCDAQGSDEYNIALGERRAGAVKSYLVDLGVASSRFDTVTYGERRPAVPGDGERAWRLNRRSEIRIGLQQALR
jgi:peptidoglycan-associated lipoprotein